MEKKTVASGKGEKTLSSKGCAVCVRVEIKTLYLSVSSTIARYSRMLYKVGLWIWDYSFMVRNLTICPDAKESPNK